MDDDRAVPPPGFTMAKPHYSMRSVFYLDSCDENGQDADPEIGMENLRSIFPNGRTSPNKFVMFNVWQHTDNRSIEAIERYIEEHGEGGGRYPSRHCLTVLIVQPRIAGMLIGRIRVRKHDIEYLKQLRESSRESALANFEIKELLPIKKTRKSIKAPRQP